jgi:hypothetical protein
MGIRLAMEASDFDPSALTWRERCALMILAQSAMDATRECPPGIEDRPDIIRRLDMGRSERYAVIKSLCAKGALVRVERGRNGNRAVYAIAGTAVVHLGTGPGDPDPQPVDNPVKGPGFPDASDGVKGPGSAREGSGFHPSKGPGKPDASAPDTLFFGIKGFKTGGKPPQRPAPALWPHAVPEADEGEGESPEAKAAGPSIADLRRALATEMVGERAEWTPRSVIRALEKPSVAARPWAIVAEAMRIIGADPETQGPGRLDRDGPWWAEAARRVRAATGASTGAHPYDPDPETGLCRCKADRVDKVHRTRSRRAG